MKQNTTRRRQKWSSGQGGSTHTHRGRSSYCMSLVISRTYTICFVVLKPHHVLNTSADACWNLIIWCWEKSEGWDNTTTLYENTHIISSHSFPTQHSQAGVFFNSIQWFQRMANKRNLFTSCQIKI